ncbi:MAG: hypothetical protein C5B54_09090 [Acidobacteria bacterium]|nr:MAG: hypothetical protein C5B54_09090 [Acidobacteriota bacterium]
MDIKRLSQDLPIQNEFSTESEINSSQLNNIKPEGVSDSPNVLEINNNSQSLLDAIKSRLDNGTPQQDDEQGLQFKIQTATSDMQNAENMTNDLLKDLDNTRKGIEGNMGGGGSQPSTPNTPLQYEVGDLFQMIHPFDSVDAMHGQPKTPQELQTVVQDLKTLINSLDIDSRLKLELTAEVEQLDQLSQQISSQPDAGDSQAFSQALQLLSDIRSNLTPYVNS